VWQSGAGLAADNAGNVYFTTGNGIDDAASGDFANSIVCLSPNASNGVLLPSGVFEVPDITTTAPCGAFATGCPNSLNAADMDLGSGGAIIASDMNTLIAGGKPGVLFALPANGGFGPAWTTGTLLQANGAGYPQGVQAFYNTYNVGSPPYGYADDSNAKIRGAPVYWRGPTTNNYGFVYAWGQGDYLKAFQMDNTTRYVLNNPGGQYGFNCRYQSGDAACGVIDAFGSTTSTGEPGGLLSLSANGNAGASGIIWAVLPAGINYLKQSVTQAYAAVPTGNLGFGNSSLGAPIWQDLNQGSIGKWPVATVADGKLFVSSYQGALCCNCSPIPSSTHLDIYQMFGGVNAAVDSSGTIHVRWVAHSTTCAPGPQNGWRIVNNTTQQKTSVTTPNTFWGTVPGSLTNTISVCAEVQGPDGNEEECVGPVAPVDGTKDTWFDIENADLANADRNWLPKKCLGSPCSQVPPEYFGGPAPALPSNWAQASRVAFSFCSSLGFQGGASHRLD
jgi:hypothetical protein